MRTELDKRIRVWAEALGVDAEVATWDRLVCLELSSARGLPGDPVTHPLSDWLFGDGIAVPGAAVTLRADGYATFKLDDGRWGYVHPDGRIVLSAEPTR